MKTYEMIVQELQNIHQWLIEAVDGLTEIQFSHTFSKNAPPIGWHLWHIARFADRLQASFSLPSGEEGKEIWDEEKLTGHWNLDPDDLGVLESGMEMSLEFAGKISELVGKDRIQDYASRCFGRVDNEVTELGASQFDEQRTSTIAYTFDGEKVVESTPEKTTTGADVIYHISHASQHLGSIEALIGVFE